MSSLMGNVRKLCFEVNLASYIWGDLPVQSDQIGGIQYTEAMYVF